MSAWVESGAGYSGSCGGAALRQATISKLLVPRMRSLAEAEIWRIAQALRRLKRPKVSAVVVAALAVLIAL
jgi:hypothetical protein